MLLIEARCQYLHCCKHFNKIISIKYSLSLADPGQWEQCLENAAARCRGQGSASGSLVGLGAPRDQSCCGTTVEIVPLGLRGENLTALGVWAGSAWSEVQGVGMDTGKSSKEAFQWHHEPGKAVSSVLET